MAAALAPAGAAIVSAVLNYPLASCATVAAIVAARHFGIPVLSCCRRPAPPLAPPRVTRTSTTPPVTPPPPPVAATPTPPPTPRAPTPPPVAAAQDPREVPIHTLFEEASVLSPAGDQELPAVVDFENLTREQWNLIDFFVWTVHGCPQGDPEFGKNNRYTECLRPINPATPDTVPDLLSGQEKLHMIAQYVISHFPAPS